MDHTFGCVVGFLEYFDLSLGCIIFFLFHVGFECPQFLFVFNIFDEY